jgi:hypothetical protein
MKLGRRSKDDEPNEAAKAAAAAEAAADVEVTSETWTPADERAAAPEPASRSWTAADERAAGPDPEPVVEGEAVELTGSAPAAEPAARPVPLTIHEPPVRHDAPPPPSNPIVDVSGAPSPTAPSFDGHAHEPPADPLEPIRALADARPELVVGAAFAGGILAAMILRRLGN